MYQELKIALNGGILMMNLADKLFCNNSNSIWLLNLMSKINAVNLFIRKSHAFHEKKQIFKQRKNVSMMF